MGLSWNGVQFSASEGNVAGFVFNEVVLQLRQTRNDDTTYTFHHPRFGP